MIEKLKPKYQIPPTRLPFVNGQITAAWWRCIHIRLLLVILATMAPFCPAVHGQAIETRSKTITSLLREPLPPEELSCSVTGDKIVIKGPTYAYTVEKATGAIVGLEVSRESQTVIHLDSPANMAIGDYSISGKGNAAETSIIVDGKPAVAADHAAKLVLETKGTLKSSTAGDADLPYTLTNTFFNDGVVVCQWSLVPGKDLWVKDIRHEVVCSGTFKNYLHKTRDKTTMERFGLLPGAGEAVKFSSLTSCLQVISSKAAIAIFTDSGAAGATPGADTATIEVKSRKTDEATLSLVQHLVHDTSEKGYLLQAHSPFKFRVGIAVAPMRLPNPMRHDLRMFTWIGDGKSPYPSDQEILNVAQLGYTMFSMHRAGTPGEPRPPADQFERVVKTVHSAGMLFIQTANADLMYSWAPGVQEMRASGKWALWQGFNYGGRYQDSMDRYCDMAATCVASPNGLAEYRLATDSRMMDRYAVDGMYLDDNIAYANCTLWKEHGHPQKLYDCLIELHDMNWQRRQLLRSRCPHAVLIDHCSKEIILPVICDFDAQLFGEGFAYGSAENYWDYFGSLQYMYAQCCMWPGGTEKGRSSTEIAYNYDLLTGGGKYMYIDWRLYHEKYPYASGVTADEAIWVRMYTRAESYFGMYESTPFYFAESADVFSMSAPQTYATIYRNDVWGDCLVVIANMNTEAKETSLTFRSPDRLKLAQTGRYVLLDVKGRTARSVDAGTLQKEGLLSVRVPARGMKLFWLRQVPREGPFHLWGGKRISETWDAKSQTLALAVYGPVGLIEEVFLDPGEGTIREVRVNGKPAAFYLDPAQRIVHGEVTFGAEPVRIEAICGPADAAKLPEKSITPVVLPNQ